MRLTRESKILTGQCGPAPKKKGCFFYGGLRYSQQGFGNVGASLSSSVLIVSVIAMLVPTGFDATVTIDYTEEAPLIVRMSHIVAIALIATYFAYLGFQLITHRHLYHNPNGDRIGTTDEEQAMFMGRLGRFFRSLGERPDARSAPARQRVYDDDQEKPEMNVWVALFMAAVIMVSSVSSLGLPFPPLTSHLSRCRVSSVPLPSSSSVKLSTCKRWPLL